MADSKEREKPPGEITMPGGGTALRLDVVDPLRKAQGFTQAGPGEVRMAPSLELTLSDNTRITFGRLATVA